MAFTGIGVRPSRPMPTFSSGWATGSSSERPEHWRGLTAAFAPFLGAASNPLSVLFGSKIVPANVSGTISNSNARWSGGRAWQFVQATSDGIVMGKADDLLSTTECTIAVGFRRDLSTNPTGGGFVGTSGGFQVTNCAAIQLPDTNGDIGWAFSTSALLVSNYTTLASVSQHNTHIVIFTAGPLGRQIWFDGQLTRVNTSPPNTRVLDAANNFGIGTGVLGSGSPMGMEVGFCYVWNRQLSPAAVLEITVDPGLLFRPSRDAVGFIGSVVSTVDIAGATSGVASAVCSLSGQSDIAGEADGIASASCSLINLDDIAGATSGVASVLGSFIGYASILGSIAGVAAASASTSGTTSLSGTVAGTATITGNLFDRFGGHTTASATVVGSLALRSTVGGVTIGTSLFQGTLGDVVLAIIAGTSAPNSGSACIPFLATTVDAFDTTIEVVTSENIGVLEGPAGNPPSYTVSVVGPGSPVSVIAISFVNNRLRLDTTAQSFGAAYTLHMAVGGMLAISGKPFSGPYNLSFLGGASQPAGIQLVRTVDARTIDIVFNRRVNESDASNPVNYLVSPTLAVLKAKKRSDYHYRLTTSQQAIDQAYTVTISNIRGA